MKTQTCDTCRKAKPLKWFPRLERRSYKNPGRWGPTCKPCFAGALERKTGVRVCGKCGKSRALSAFPKNPKGRNGLGPTCNLCMRRTGQEITRSIQALTRQAPRLTVYCLVETGPGETEEVTLHPADGRGPSVIEHKGRKFLRYGKYDRWSKYGVARYRFEHLLPEAGEVKEVSADAREVKETLTPRPGGSGAQTPGAGSFHPRVPFEVRTSFQLSEVPA